MVAGSNCTSNVKSEALAVYSQKNLKPRLREREKKFFYDITFKSRPLYISVTSSTTNINGYVTAIAEECAVKDKIIIGSKVIYINEVLVEGQGILQIAKHLRGGNIPLKLTMVRPEGLMSDEAPEKEPESIVLFRHQSKMMNLPLKKIRINGMKALVHMKPKAKDRVNKNCVKMDERSIKLSTTGVFGVSTLGVVATLIFLGGLRLYRSIQPKKQPDVASLLMEVKKLT